MHTYIHTYTHAHIHSHSPTNTYIYIYVHGQIHTCTYIHMDHNHKCAYTVHAHTHKHMHAYPHACVHMYIHTYMPAYRRTDMYRRTDGHVVLAAAGPIHRFHLFSEPLASRFDQTRLAAIPEAMPTRSCTSQEAQLRRRGGHKVGSQNKGCFGTHSLLPLALALSGLPAME